MMEKIDFLVIFLSSLLVVSFSLAIEFFLILIRKLDIEKIKEVKKEIKEKQEKMKKLIKKVREVEKDEELFKIQKEVSKLQKEIIQSNFKIFKERMKVSLINWIPAILVFVKLSEYFRGISIKWLIIYFLSFIVIDKIMRKIVKLDY